MVPVQDRVDVAPEDGACDQTFPKAERLLRRADYVRVQRGSGDGARRFRTSRLVIASLPTGGPRRIGITVSKKVGNSPVRSQVKRWVREAYRLHKDEWPQGVDFVVIARAPALAAGYHKIVEDMRRWARWFSAQDSP